VSNTGETRPSHSGIATRIVSKLPACGTASSVPPAKINVTTYNIL
jgi:hypothetical protein